MHRSSWLGLLVLTAGCSSLELGGSDVGAEAAAAGLCRAEVCGREGVELASSAAPLHCGSSQYEVSGFLLWVDDEPSLYRATVDATFVDSQGEPLGTTRWVLRPAPPPERPEMGPAGVHKLLVEVTPDGPRDYAQVFLHTKNADLSSALRFAQVAPRRCVAPPQRPVDPQRERLNRSDVSFGEAALSTALPRVGLDVYRKYLQSRVTPLYGARVWKTLQGWSAVDQLFVALDYGSNAQGIAAFHQELLELMQDARAAAWVDEVAARLFRARDDAEPYDLWAHTLSRAGDEATAVRWIAVLLQDTTGTHLGWLSGREDVDPARLDRLTDANSVLDRSPTLAARVRFYVGQPALEGTRLYHHYVPRYLAQKLVAKGTSPEGAFLASYLMNTEYELLMDVKLSDCDECSTEGWSAIAKTVQSATGPVDRPLDSVELQGMFEDLYMGYRGAMVGSGWRAPASEASFRPAFARSPQKYTEALFQ